MSLLDTKFSPKSSRTSTLTEIHVLFYKSAKVIIGKNTRNYFDGRDTRPVET